MRYKQTTMLDYLYILVPEAHSSVISRCRILQAEDLEHQPIEFYVRERIYNACVEPPFNIRWQHSWCNVVQCSPPPRHRFQGTTLGFSGEGTISDKNSTHFGCIIVVAVILEGRHT